jgi:hypothetical protein
LLKITIPAREADDLWDEENQVFIPVPAQKEQILCLEHSLVSLSKWESKWCKAFFSKREKTYEETIDYIRCMTITPNVNPDVYYNISDENIAEISKYIEAPMTATVFSEDTTRKNNRETITSELIYYWMIESKIPFECQKWHINRLLTLIRVCNIKNAPPKKRSRSEIMRQQAALNAARRKKLNTKG